MKKQKRNKSPEAESVRLEPPKPSYSALFRAGPPELLFRSGERHFFVQTIVRFEPITSGLQAENRLVVAELQ